MSFSPLRVDGGGLLQVFDVATSANSGVTAGTVIAGADTQGFYLSSTATPGDAWTVQNKGVGAATFYRQCAAVMWSVREPNTIYAAVGNDGKNGGLLVSADGGNSWSRRSSVPQFAGNTAAAPVGGSPPPNWARSTGRLLVQDGASNWLFAGTYAQGVLRDSNNGLAGFSTAIQMAGAAPGTNNWFCRSLVQAPGTPTTLYAAFYDSTGVTGAVWKCNNAHATTPNFVQMAGSPPTPEELCVLANGDVVAACGSNGLYLLPNGSTTWSSLNGTTIDVHGSFWTTLDGYVDGSLNRVIFAACSNMTVNAATIVSLTVPQNWPASGSITYANKAGTVQSTTIPPTNYTWWNSGSGDILGKAGFVNPCLRFDPNDGTHQKVYISGAQGFYRSANGGTSWTIANSGLPQFLAHPLAADPNHNGHVLFGDSDWCAFDDTSPTTETASTLVNDPPVKDTGVISNTKGVQGYSFAFDPVDSTVYIGIGRKYTNQIGDVYARTWNNPGGVGTYDGGGYTGLTNGSLALGSSAAAGNVPIGLCALRDISNNKMLIAAVWGSGIWRWEPSGGGGTYQWVQRDTSIASATTTVGNCVPFAHKAGSQYVYAFDRQQGIFRSTDYGASWALICPVTTNDLLSGDIDINPGVGGELWFTAKGNLYHLTGAQAGTFTLPAPVLGPGATPPTPYVGPVAYASANTLLVATTDTGTGAGLLISTDNGATFVDAVGDSSFAEINCNPEHIDVGPDGRVYVSGSNIVATGLISTTPTSAAFTEVQASQAISSAGGTGLCGLWFNQNGGAPSQVGSALVARLESNDCSQTITAPPGWVLAADAKSGALNGQARAQVWVYLNNPGGLGGPQAPSGLVRGAAATPGFGQPRPAVTAAPALTGAQLTAYAPPGPVLSTAGPGPLEAPAPPVTTQIFTGSNSSATLKGKLHEYSTPAGTVQFLDQAGTGGAVASATSLPVTATGANTFPGGLGVVMFGAVLSGGTTGQTWSNPTGWTTDGSGSNAVNVFDARYLAADAAGTTSVTGSITLGTWAMTSWAAALATMYALAGTPVDIITPALPQGMVNAAYSVTIGATGGSAPYTFTQSGGTLPTGLTLSSAGVLSGTPSAAGTYSFSVTVTDSAGQADTDPFVVTILAASTLAITTASLPDGTQGTAYGPTGTGVTLTASGGSGTYTWAVTAGSLPPGLTLASGGLLSGTPTATGTYTFTISVTDQLPTTVSASFSVTIAIPAPPPPPPGTVAPPTDSLIIADQIELLGGPGGSPSANPACAGAIFHLQPGYDLSAPQPTTDIVGSLILDGERPFGYRASNRVITLPIMVEAADFATLAGAYEVLMAAIDQQAWTLTWTRRDGLPLVLDCFRAQPTVVTWGGADQTLGSPVGAIALTFQALPYGRSDAPVTVPLPSPLPMQTAPPPPIVLDNYATVTGAQWVQSAAHVVGPNSAQWNPCLAPLSSCTGESSQPGASYQATLAAAVDITGLTALSVWAGFGSDYFSTWSGGPAVFAWTLTDASGNTLAFSRTLTVQASNDSASPKWQRVTAPIPQDSTTFDYTNVAGYSVVVTNRGYHTLRFTQLYLDALTANPPSVAGPPSIRGAMYSLLGVQGTARTPCSAQFAQAPGTAPQQTVLLPGPVGSPQQWTAPPGVTSIKVEVTGGGGGGSCGGGGGGAYSSSANVQVTPGTAYSYQIAGGGNEGFAGGGGYFIGDIATISANGGAPGTPGGPGGAGGTTAGGQGTVKHNGGNGAAGAPNTSGGGGGGSAGSGTAGGNASGTTGGAAGTGTTPGAVGGAGTTADRDGFPGIAPGSGGGGTGDLGDNHGAVGAPGQVKLTYTSSVAPFSTLIAHRPGPSAPQDLCPLVSPGPTDVPNGATEYPVPSLTPGVYADFNGTYTVVAVANVWNNPSVPRTVTIGVKQYEYAGGPAYTTSVSRTFTPSTDTFIPGGATLAQVPFAVIGELTLPPRDVAPDNASGLYTVTVTDSNTSDTFLDILLLDALGQTVMIGEATTGAYANYYLDEPSPDRDLGRVMGSDFDRSSAISVLDSALVSGGPLYLEPGDNILLVYALEGAPALSVSYSPRWFLDRLT